MTSGSIDYNKLGRNAPKEEHKWKVRALVRGLKIIPNNI
jgi:hypothetical protein